MVYDNNNNDNNTMAIDTNHGICIFVVQHRYIQNNAYLWKSIYF